MINSCGLDTNSKLNEYERAYFKDNIRRLNSIDLCNKKFAFAHGNFGKTIISKKYYFEEWGRDYFNRNIRIFNILIELTEEEKQQSGGYDYIIISWSKTLPVGNSRKKLIERLRNYSRGEF